MNLRWTKFLAALAMILTVGLSLSGCAFKKIIYDRLDWVLMYQLDTYLDLEKEQKLKFKPALAEAVSWLKREKVPHAITVLEKLEDAAKRKTYDESVNKAFTAEIDLIRSELFRKYEGPVLELLLSLSEKQISYLQKKMAKSNEDMEDALKENDLSVYDKLLKKQKKTLEEYYGPLSKSQEEEFFNVMRITKEQVERRLAERKRIQAYLIETLKSKDKAKVQSLIQTFRDTGEFWQDPVYLEYRKVSEKRWEDYLLSFHQTLAPEQWQHLADKLRETIAELRSMIAS